MTIRFLLAAALVAVALPAAASAKGPVDATITGPGLDTPLVFGGGEYQGTAVMSLADAAGFWPGAYGSGAGSGAPTTLAHAPGVRLGPRYTIVWNVPTGSDTADRLVQELYPYADGRPYSYMKPGQPLFDRATAGGWFAADASLKQLLVRKGLPRAAPRAAARGGRAREWLIGGFGVAALAAFAVGRSSIAAWRRRSTSTTRAPSV